MEELKTSIEIIGLRIPVCIGCLPEERTKNQDLAFDIVIHFDALKSCKSDRLDQTIDYMSVRNLLIDTCETNQFYLLEKLAWVSVERIFSAFPLAQEIHFKIKKFEPIPEAQHIGFEIKTKRTS